MDDLIWKIQTTKLVGVFAPLNVLQPVPKTTVAQTKEVQQNQNFDLTAFVLSRHPVRNGGDGRKVFDLELADDSTDEMSGKVQTILLSVFASDADVAAQVEFADKSKDQKVPVSFFNVRGNKVADQNAYTFSSARKGFSMIVAVSPRALEMQERALELYNLEDKEAVPQTQWIPNEKSFA